MLSPFFVTFLRCPFLSFLCSLLLSRWCLAFAYFHSGCDNCALFGVLLDWLSRAGVLLNGLFGAHSLYVIQQVLSLIGVLRSRGDEHVDLVPGVQILEWDLLQYFFTHLLFPSQRHRIHCSGLGTAFKSKGRPASNWRLWELRKVSEIAFWLDEELVSEELGRVLNLERKTLARSGSDRGGIDRSIESTDGSVQKGAQFLHRSWREPNQLFTFRTGLPARREISAWKERSLSLDEGVEPWREAWCFPVLIHRASFTYVQICIKYGDSSLGRSREPLVNLSEETWKGDISRRGGQCFGNNCRLPFESECDIGAEFGLSLSFDFFRIPIACEEGGVQGGWFNQACHRYRSEGESTARSWLRKRRSSCSVAVVRSCGAGNLSGVSRHSSSCLDEGSEVGVEGTPWHELLRRELVFRWCSGVHFLIVRRIVWYALLGNNCSWSAWVPSLWMGGRGTHRESSFVPIRGWGSHVGGVGT